MNKAISLLFLLPVFAAAQQSVRPPLSINPSASAPDPTVYVSAQDIADRIKLGLSMKSGAPSNGRVALLTQPPFEIDMEDFPRPAAEAVVDESSAELYLVLNGSGTFSVGGKLIEPKRTGGILSGSKTEGGTLFALHKGDILVVPPNAPHFVSGSDGKLAIMSVHIPVGTPNLWPGGNGFFAATGDPNVYISAQDIAERRAKADAAIDAGLPDRGPFMLISQPPFKVTMDDRKIPNGHIDAHPQTAELFVVLAGSGTMVVSGKLVNPKGQGNDLQAESTDGGTLYKVHPGDIVLVPANAAHAVVEIEGKLTMMQVHIPTAGGGKTGGTAQGQRDGPPVR